MLPDQAVLGDDEEGHHALVPEVGQQLVELGDRGTAPRAWR